MYFVLIIFYEYFLVLERIMFLIFLMWKFALIYECLDYVHVSGTNYTRKPRYHCIKQQQSLMFCHYTCSGGEILLSEILGGPCSTNGGEEEIV
jgi:hypothetical protein